MAELKTKPNDASVEEFLNRIEDETRRKDCRTIMEMMRQVTGENPRMWGDAVVGFGNYHYKYATGHEGDIFRVGFSPRKQNLTLYLNYGDYTDLLQRLGKHKTGKGCLYIKRLDDVNLDALREIISRAAERYPSTG